MISIVLPCYNEELVLDAFFEKLLPILRGLDEPFEIVCVNDGSRDATLSKLLKARVSIPEIKVIDLSRNFGKEAALTAGIDHARGEAVIPIDADLQDPPELIPEMVRRWKSGAEVVLCQRDNRDSDALIKRTSANWFYRLHNRIAETQIPENVGDYRLMDRKVVEAVRQLPESRRFMKGVFAWVGFKPEVIAYAREKRAAGQTKFSGWRLWNFAIEGITSFSTVPLHVCLYVGALIAMLALIFAGWIVAKTIFLGVDLPGYASLMVSILFLGGVQLIAIGIMGEYIGRIYAETKRRPIYIVRDVHE